MAYYVKIDNPREFRRDILESSKKVIGSLQANRNVQFLRQKKLQLLERLQLQIKEIGLLQSKLDKLLPEKELREEALQQLRQIEKERKGALRRAFEQKKIEEERFAQESTERERMRREQEEFERRQRAEKKRQQHEEQLAPVEPVPARVAPSPEPARKELLPEERPLDEMDQLDRALASIEQKLATLQ